MRLPLIKSCNQSWEDMSGDMRTRHCEACDRQVHDLTQLRAIEANALLLVFGSREMCVRYTVDEQGEVMHAPEPRSRALHLRRSGVRAPLGAGALALALSSPPACAPSVPVVVEHPASPARVTRASEVPPVPPPPPPPSDRDGDGILDMHDRCPDVPAAAVDGCPQKHTIVVGGIGPANLRLTENIFFKRGTSTMTDMGPMLVDEIVRVLRSNPVLGKVAIQGHATPDEPRALQLSEARARLVRDRLISAGIEAERLIVEGLGASQPRVPNTTPDNRNRNRRVEFDVRAQAGCPPKP